MNILFSLTYYFPYTSGLSIIAKRLAEKLALKHKVSALCIQHEPKLSNQESVDGVLVTRVKPNIKISKGFLSLDWIFKSWKYVKNTDVLIVCLPQPEAVFIILFACLLRKRIISLYLAEVKLRNGLLSGLFEFMLNTTDFISLNFSHKIVTYSQEYAQYANSLRPFQTKVECIYPPIPKLTATKKALKKIEDSIDKTFGIRIGIQARMAEDKGFEYLFESLPFIENALGKKVAIIIAGPMDPVGEEKYKEKIMKEANKIKHSLFFLGNLDQSEMGSFYKSIDVLVYPSILESFGLGQVEAMMLGVPVVSTNLPGNSVPIIRTQLGELVPLKNPKLLAEAIVKIIKNKKNYINPEKAAFEFNIEKVMEKYEKLLLSDDRIQ